MIREEGPEAVRQRCAVLCGANSLLHPETGTLSSAQPSSLSEERLAVHT